MNEATLSTTYQPAQHVYDLMPELLANRRQNLKALATMSGGPVALSKRLGYKNASYITQMYAEPGSSKHARSFVEKRARIFEQQLGLPAGLMDETHEVFLRKVRQYLPAVSLSSEHMLPTPHIAVAPPAPLPPGSRVDPAGVPSVRMLVPPPAGATQVNADAAEMAARAMQVIATITGGEGVNLPPPKLLKIAEMTLRDAAEHGVLRESFVQELVRLMK